MTEIMLSIRPKWCELIASGRKTIEIRKTKPNCDVPFKVYIYCTKDFRTSTKDRNHEFWIGEPINGVSDGRYLGNGKVIGEFVCKAILPISVTYSDTNSRLALRVFPYTCLTDKEITDYIGNVKTVYGWHISDFIIYDKPKDLSDFGMKRPPQSWCYAYKNM